jgi:K+-transporting ATPase KdpF subunit
MEERCFMCSGLPVGKSRGPADGAGGRDHDGVDVGIRQRNGQVVSSQDLIGLIVGVILLGYLVYALIRPERF